MIIILAILIVINVVVIIIVIIVVIVIISSIRSQLKAKTMAGRLHLYNTQKSFSRLKFKTSSLLYLLSFCVNLTPGMLIRGLITYNLTN